MREDQVERKDLYYTGPTEFKQEDDKKTIIGREVALEVDEKQAHAVNHTLSMMSVIRSIDEYRRDSDEEVIKKKHVPKFITALKLLFDMDLLRSQEFRILLFSAFCYTMGMNIPFVYSKGR